MSGIHCRKYISRAFAAAVKQYFVQNLHKTSIIQMFEGRTGNKQKSLDF